MKFFLWTLSAVFALSLSACGGDTESDTKTAWTAKERKVFREGCFLSARFSFEQLKQQVDSADIVTICNCTADEVESQYNFAAAKRIPKAEIHKIIGDALVKCAPEAALDQNADTTTVAP